MRMPLKKIALLLAALGLTAAACAQKLKGSDTLLPLAQKAAENYSEKNPSAHVTVTGGGSGVGLSSLREGTTDIAMASRRIKFDERVRMQQAGRPVEELTVAFDALAVIVHPSNPVSRLTREQLEGIFRGKITNWKQVGGEDRKIVVYSRETSSGTYEFFKESVLKHRNYMPAVTTCRPRARSSSPSVRRPERSVTSDWPISTRRSRRSPFLTTEAGATSPRRSTMPVEKLSDRPAALLLLYEIERGRRPAAGRLPDFGRGTGYGGVHRFHSDPLKPVRARPNHRKP